MSTNPTQKKKNNNNNKPQKQCIIRQEINTTQEQQQPHQATENKNKERKRSLESRVFYNIFSNQLIRSKRNQECKINTKQKKQQTSICKKLNQENANIN